jgi:SsrA-binding protein
VKIVSQNRAASYNYHLLDSLEAGLVLVGTEVKSLREGKGTLREAYAEIRVGEAWLVNCHIPEYLPGGFRNHDPLRKRKLLLNRRELDRLLVQTQQKGMTIVPTKIYFRDGIAKCELAVAKGKKFHDRREAEKQKEAKREANEAIYRSRRR